MRIYVERSASEERGVVVGGRPLKLGWLEGDRDWYLTEYPNPDGTKGILLFEYQKLLDNRVKKVKRHVDQVEKTFESIENGTFP